MHEPGTRRGRAQLPYLPGIDGLRALAVVAVVLYHADVAMVRAGFLGVDVFFVISGYLIASLLLAERAATGAIAIGDFWRRRARRLLPALFALLAGVTAAALLLARDAAGRLTGDLPAAGLYVSNWWQIVRGESYFESMGRPPLLRHLWSLAVEEQFYVVVPVALAALFARGLHRRRLGLIALGLALASALWMAVLWSPDDTARVYFGTDTRAAPLLLGVALATVWRPGALSADVQRSARVVLDLVGAVALVALTVLVLTADEYGAGLYRGGFLLAAVASAVVVAIVAHPATHLGALLGRRPFTWLGERSYAVYLWHWPVVVLTRPGLDVDLDGPALLVLRIAASLALAELSYRFVEQPFREGRAQRAFRSRRAVERRRISAAVLGLSVAAWLAVAVVPATVGDTQLVAAAAEGPASTLATWPSTTDVPTTKATAATTTTTVAAVSDTTAPPTTAAPVTQPPPVGPPAGPVLALGDSVLLASRAALEHASGGMVQVDAAVGRQVWDLLELIERYRAAGAFSQLSALVVHLGTNGPLHARDFDRLAAAVEGVPRVVVLNVRVPQRWEETTNTTLRDGVPRFANMRLVDWYGASGQPGMLGDDGVHPSRDGAAAYARIVLEQLHDLTPPPPPPTTTTTTTPPETAPPTTAPPTTAPPTTAPSTTAPPPSPDSTTTTSIVLPVP